MNCHLSSASTAATNIENKIYMCNLANILEEEGEQNQPWLLGTLLNKGVKLERWERLV
jgi:hypothetical protein